MQNVFSKKFISPSSDLITVFAGLESIDHVFSEFLENISEIIKLPRESSHPLTLSVQVNSIRAANIAAGGSYQTSLSSYFTHHNLFNSIMSFIDSASKDTTAMAYIGDAFSLLGVLASFDKFEAVNPYRTRLSDFVNHESMNASIVSSGHVWNICFQRYISIASGTVSPTSASQPRLPPASILASYYYYWFPSSSNTNLSADELPLEIISLTLATYEFINSNKVYARLLVESTPESQSPPFTDFLTLAKYLVQTQNKNTRASLYARLFLLIIRVLVETPSPSPLLVENASTKQYPISGVLDTLNAGIRFNMKRGLDVDFYILVFTNIFQSIHLLRETKFDLKYDWSQLWQSILSLIRFINSHLPDSNNNKGYSELVDLIILTLASALIHGETILDSLESYDDLIYKILFSSEDITKLGDNFPSLFKTPALSVLKSTINHYKVLLEESRSKPFFKKSLFSFGGPGPALTAEDLTPEKVMELIKQGHGTLSLHQHAVSKTGEGTDSGDYLLYDALPNYNEVNERLFLKRVTRQVILDVQKLHVGLA